MKDGIDIISVQASGYSGHTKVIFLLDLQTDVVIIAPEDLSNLYH